VILDAWFALRPALLSAMAWSEGAWAAGPHAFRCGAQLILPCLGGLAGKPPGVPRQFAAGYRSWPIRLPDWIAHTITPPRIGQDLPSPGWQSYGPFASANARAAQPPPGSRPPNSRRTPRGGGSVPRSEGATIQNLADSDLVNP